MKLVIVAFLALVPVAAQAADQDPPCSDQVSTVDIVACVDKDTRLWDKRLNAAYKALGSFVDPAQREPLKLAQRSWVQYRDANAAFYAAHEGTIGRILAAQCLWTMTRDRTLELEQAARP